MFYITQYPVRTAQSTVHFAFLRTYSIEHDHNFSGECLTIDVSTRNHVDYVLFKM